MGLYSSLILFLIVFLASIVQGISGFAFGIIALMGLPYFFSFTESVAIASLMTLFLLIYNTVVYRKYINWSLAPIPVIAFTVTDIVAVRLLKYTGQYDFMYLLLGVMFICLAIFLLWMSKRELRLAPTTKNAVLFNGFAGILNGLFGAGGPVAATYFLSVAKDKNEYIATVQAVFSLLLLVDVTIRALSGMFTLELIKFSIYSIVFMILGLWIAKRLFDRLSGASIQKIVCFLMILNGINLIIRSF